MTAGTDVVTTVARELYDAERLARPIPPLVARYPGYDTARAYAVQEAYATLRRSAGARRVGRKIGATSKAIQDRFDVRTPDFGHLFDDMSIPDGGTVPLAELIAPMVEPEIAFVLDRDLAGPGVTRDDVLTATRALHPAIEIIDSRIIDWQITFDDTVSDNGSSARFLLGPARGPQSAAALDEQPVRLSRDGTVVTEATGREVLGHPADAVAWLANAIGAYGARLRAGDIVLSGSFTAAVPMTPGAHYIADFPGLGHVSCRAG